MLGGSHRCLGHSLGACLGCARPRSPAQQNQTNMRVREESEDSVMGPLGSRTPTEAQAEQFLVQRFSHFTLLLFLKYQLKMGFHVQLH